MNTCVQTRSSAPADLHIHPIGKSPSYEFDIQCNGSRYHAIIGKHNSGNFIAVPDWNFGSELSYLSDHFWNLERLCACGLSESDSKNIADALVRISHMINL